MPFLPPNQQHQSTEGTSTEEITVSSYQQCTSTDGMHSPSLPLHPVQVRLSISHSATVFGQTPPAITLHMQQHRCKRNDTVNRYTLINTRRCFPGKPSLASHFLVFFLRTFDKRIFRGEMVTGVGPGFLPVTLNWRVLAY